MTGRFQFSLSTLLWLMFLFYLAFLMTHGFTLNFPTYLLGACHCNGASTTTPLLIKVGAIYDSGGAGGLEFQMQMRTERTMK